MVRSVSGAWAAKCRRGGAVGGTDDRLLSSVNCTRLTAPSGTDDRLFSSVNCPRLPSPYRVDSRGTRIGSINTVLAGRLRLELMDLISMSAACCPMAVLLWSMVESGTRNRLE